MKVTLTAFLSSYDVPVTEDAIRVRDPDSIQKGVPSAALNPVGAEGTIDASALGLAAAGWGRRGFLWAWRRQGRL